MKTNMEQTTVGRREHPRDKGHQPFVEHLQELKKRLYYIGVSLVLWSAATYAIQQQVVNALLKPSKGQHFIYTSPGGGIDFLFRICLYTGLALTFPVIIYNVLRFIEPVMGRSSRRFIWTGTTMSAILAVAGMVFGYFIGLPAALHFLLHQFTTIQIKPLVTIQSYLAFVMVYMLGSALLLQLPLIMIFINRIKPLKPQQLFHYERWVILAAFVLAGLMNPSPNILSQLLVAGPFIVIYQLGILIIYLINRRQIPANQVIDRQKRARLVVELTKGVISCTVHHELLPRTTPRRFRIDDVRQMS